MAYILRDLLKHDKLPLSEKLILIEYTIKKNKSWIIAHDDEMISEQIRSEYYKVASRRLNGEPISYITGYREFMGHEFIITPDVLIPRHDTEILVERSIEYLYSQKKPSILDLGTGSGIVAISIGLAIPDADIWACDISNKALMIAKANASKLGVNIQFVESDWFNSLGQLKKFDLIVSNPPYISKNDRHLNEGDLRFEPLMSLTDNYDGLSALRIIVKNSIMYLKPGAMLIVEHGWNQSNEVYNMFKCNNYINIETKCDLSGIKRICGGVFI